MFTSCQAKQEKVKELFCHCSKQEEKYLKILELGKEMGTLEPKYRTDSHLVPGCQSVMYLRSYAQEGLIYFEAESDALISRGLGVLLIRVYSGEAPETILKCPPTFLEELEITSSLTPNRASGLYSMHLKMKQEALKHLTGIP